MDDSDDLPPTRRPRGRPKAAGALAARALVQRLAWIDCPLIYWTGKPLAAERCSATAALQARLKQRVPGPYAVRLTAPVACAEFAKFSDLTGALAPAVADIVPITVSLIATSLRRLAKLRRFPVALPKLVGDVASWRSRCEAALHKARALLDSGADSGQLYETCLMIGELHGPTARAPSPRPQRSSPFGPASPAQLLSAWPPDLLHQVAQLIGARALLQLARAAPAANQADVATAIRDRLLLSPSTCRKFANDLPALLRLYDRLADEPHRRLRAATSIQRDCIESAIIEAGAAGDPLLCADGVRAPTDRMICHFQQSYENHLADAINKWFKPILPGAPDPSSSPKTVTSSQPANVIRDVLAARPLCRALLGTADPLASDRDLVRVSARDKRPVLLTAIDRQPLSFETLPNIAAQLLWTLDGHVGVSVSRALWLTLAAIGAIPCAVAAADWVKACCAVWPLGGGKYDYAQAAIVAMHVASARAGAAQRDAAMQALNTVAHSVLRRALAIAAGVPSWCDTRESVLADDAQLIGAAVGAGLSAEDVSAIFAEDRTAALVALLAHAPGHAKQFLAFLRYWSDRCAAHREGVSRSAQLAEWALSGSRAGLWAKAFVALGPDLVRRLLDMLMTFALDPSETAGFLRDTAQFVIGYSRDISDAISPAAVGAQTARRALVSRSLPLLCSALQDAGGISSRADMILALFIQCLEVCATAAQQQTAPLWPSALELLRSCLHGMLQRLPPDTTADDVEFFARHSDRNLATLIALARGRPERLLAIGCCPLNDLSYRDFEQINEAWRYIQRLDLLPEWISSIASREGRAHRAVRLLARLGLCVRLRRPAGIVEALAAIDRPSPPPAPTSVPLSPEHAVVLRELRRWRHAGDLPDRIAEIVDRPEALRRELVNLQGRAVLQPAARNRLEHLRGLLADSAGLADWMRRDLDKHLPAALDDARLARLEEIADAIISAHFADVLDVPLPPDRSQRNWDNALRLYFSVEANRPLLRRLLRHAARGDNSWILQQPDNARFLRDVAAIGIDTDAWLAPMVCAVASPAGPCRIELETDPLHVLQMGNYFSTCLSEGDCNAFSTIANAVEVNKRVIYVYDERNTVIGRKLIVLTRKGQLLGFHTYGRLPRQAGGDTDRQIKSALDAFCAELATRCRAKLHPFPELSLEGQANDPGRLALFAQWYNDGPEPFEPRVLASQTAGA